VFIRGIRSPFVFAERDGKNLPALPLSRCYFIIGERKMEDVWQRRKLGKAERKMRKSAVTRFDFVAMSSGTYSIRVEGQKKLSSQSSVCDMQVISIFSNCKSRSILLKVEKTSFRAIRFSHIGKTSRDIIFEF
jgi:hypothetical protein